ncbi:hypothetical protein SAMN04487787_111105 [Kosakonia sacchari]|nr:hypothetical protein SAMN04487787_111105 [Kosakonia sacchari]
MLKILLWVILIIFLIGLLVVTGVFKMIFQCQAGGGCTSANLKCSALRQVNFPARCS